MSHAALEADALQPQGVRDIDALPHGLHGQLEAFPISVVLADPVAEDCPIVMVNRAFERLTQYQSSDIVGRNCRFLQGPDTDREEVARVRDELFRIGETRACLLNYRRDRSTFYNVFFVMRIDIGISRRLLIGWQFPFERKVDLHAPQLIPKEVGVAPSQLGRFGVSNMVRVNAMQMRAETMHQQMRTFLRHYT